MVATLQPEEIEWLFPWRCCSAEEEQRLVRSLLAEIGPFHPLFWCHKSLRAIARNEIQDDVLYQCTHTDRLIEVHLTWAGRHWLSRSWPSTQFFDTLQLWRQQRMEPEHKEFKKG